MLRNVAQAIVEFVKESKTLSPQFCFAWQGALYEKRQQAREFYFCLLRYDAIFASCGKRNGRKSGNAQNEARKVVIKNAVHGASNQENEPPRVKNRNF